MNKDTELAIAQCILENKEVVRARVPIRLQGNEIIWIGQVLKWENFCAFLPLFQHLLRWLPPHPPLPPPPFISKVLSLLW